MTWIFASDRNFQPYDYTATKSQLLLRSGGATRIDVLFRLVRVQKLCGWYAGLRIRHATEAERQRIEAETPKVIYDDEDVFFVLEEGTGFDYVVAGGVRWHEGPDPGVEAGHFADLDNVGSALRR